MKRNFNEWISNFKESIATHNYYVDFEKVYRNVNNIKIELNILNSLIGSKNIEQDFIDLVEKYPETLKCIPLLLAIRANEIPVVNNIAEFKYNFKNMNYPIKQYIVFMRETGLFDLFENHIINNLVDYATGVETGLDSNGNIDLSAISNSGKSEKRFDFVIKTSNMIYAIEANFYATSGSKLNETARSYKQLSQEADAINGFTFVWFTDGYGWKNARNNLEETFDVMDNIYSIHDLENNIIERVII